MRCHFVSNLSCDWATPFPALSFCLSRSQDKSLEKTNVKIDWNKFVDEDEEEGSGEAKLAEHNTQRRAVIVYHTYLYLYSAVTSSISSTYSRQDCQ